MVTHGCVIACALKQTFAQCKIFLERTLPPALLKWGQRGRMCLFSQQYHTGSFMVCQNHLKTNLLQLFAQSEVSECFSIFSVIVFEVNIIAEKKLS